VNGTMEKQQRVERLIKSRALLPKVGQASGAVNGGARGVSISRIKVRTPKQGPKAPLLIEHRTIGKFGWGDDNVTNLNW